MSFFRFLRSLLPREINVPQHLGQKILVRSGYFKFRTLIAAEGAKVPDIGLYRPLFSPWEGLPAFRPHYDAVRKHTLVSPDRCWILASCIHQAKCLSGDFAEFGVFRGGTALLAARLLAESRDARTLHLFDSFAGMPQTSANEPYEAGDFGQTSEAKVRTLVASTEANVKLHVGFIPDTFPGAAVDRLAFAHIDVDLYQSVIDCIGYVYPRLVPGGILIFDDYGFPGCIRAREAVDQAFAFLREKPIYLPTGQALVIKLPEATT